MKNILLLTALLVLITSCTDKKFEYPNDGIYGPNILSLNDGDSIQAGDNYSMKAIAPKNKELVIKIVNTSNADTSEAAPSGGIWLYGSSSVEGWAISDYSSQGQSFTSQSEINDLRIRFMNSGSCDLEYYEKSDSPTKTIHLYW